MTSDLQLFLHVCEKLYIPYTAIDATNSAFVLQFNNHRHEVVHRMFGLNSDVQGTFCRDKYYQYQLLHTVVHVPETVAYFDPSMPYAEMRRFTSHKTISEIKDEVVCHFSSPVIIKKNQGSKGEAVYLCHNANEVLSAITSVFNQHNYFYDYIVLAQEYIPHVAEYRVVWFDGQVRFAYKKDIANARFAGNLSPLHWEGAQSVLVTDEQLMAKFSDAMRRIYTVFPITYCGADFVQRKDGSMCLIELNHAPGFEEYLKTAPKEPLIALYEAIIAYLAR